MSTATCAIHHRRTTTQRHPAPRSCSGTVKWLAYRHRQNARKTQNDPHRTAYPRPRKNPRHSAQNNPRKRAHHTAPSGNPMRLNTRLPAKPAVPGLRWDTSQPSAPTREAPLAGLDFPTANSSTPLHRPSPCCTAIIGGSGRPTLHEPFAAGLRPGRMEPHRASVPSGAGSHSRDRRAWPCKAPHRHRRAYRRAGGAWRNLYCA